MILSYLNFKFIDPICDSITQLFKWKHYLADIPVIHCNKMQAQSCMNPWIEMNSYKLRTKSKIKNPNGLINFGPDRGTAKNLEWEDIDPTQDLKDLDRNYSIFWTLKIWFSRRLIHFIWMNWIILINGSKLF